MSAIAVDCAGLRCGSCLNGRRGYEAVSFSGRLAEGYSSLVTFHNSRPRESRPRLISGPRADNAWFGGQDSGYGYGNRSERVIAPCSAASTSQADGLTVPSHWGLSDGISKEFAANEEIGVIYSNEPCSSAAEHAGSVRDSSSKNASSHKLATGEAGATQEVRDHTQGKTADGFRVLDEDLAGSGGGIHDDGRKFKSSGPVPALVHTGKSSSGRLAPASLSQSMQAVSGRGLKAVVGVAAPMLTPNPGTLKGGAGMMAATLTVAGVVGAVSQGANLLQKGTTLSPTKVCRTCKGSGHISCDLCQGTGQIRWEGKYRHKDECPSCEGKGEAKCHCKAILKVPDLVPRK